MMAQLKILSPAAKFLKKLKDKRLKALYQEAIDRILEDHTVGEAKTGDLAGVFGYDIYYNKTNYELAYTVEWWSLWPEPEKTSMTNSSDI